MPWYRVAYLPTILNDLRHPEPPLAQRLLDKTKWLVSNVANLRHDSMHHDLLDLIQYAVADWRILYAVDREDHVVIIHRVCTRRELYHRGSLQKN